MQLFIALLQLIGCYQIRTTAYHPSSNGIIERLHRSMKAEIICHARKEWTRALSTVLLGLRSNVLDVGSAPAEFMYETTLRIPGEFVFLEDFASNSRIFLKEFCERMKTIKPIPVQHRAKKKAVMYKNLNSCTRFFFRVGTTQRSLERMYTDPHKIINDMSDRIFEIDVNDVTKQVSIDNIKPAYFLRDDIENIVHPPALTASPKLGTYERKKKVRFVL